MPKLLQLKYNAPARTPFQKDQSYAENELDSRGYDENINLNAVQRNTTEIWGEGQTSYSRARWIHPNEQKLEEG
jgi:hypothetical protein